MTDVFFSSAAARAVAPAAPMLFTAAVQHTHDPKAPRVSVTIQTERARSRKALAPSLSASERASAAGAAACPSAPDPPSSPPGLRATLAHL